MAGCGAQTPKPPTPGYADLGAKKNVPEYMKGTIWERTELMYTEPFAVSGYGLIGSLRGTGDSYAPTAVREYMIREMVKHGFGTRRFTGDLMTSPEAILRDPHYAIVRVDGLIPPGTRKGDRVDVAVSALPENGTSSLAHGVLFQTDLRVLGTQDPRGNVNAYVQCEGPVFVNPSYALAASTTQPAARASLRQGVILDGGRALSDHSLGLRLRQPGFAMARAMERRINQRFQDVLDIPTTTEVGRMQQAAARDEGLVYFWVPRAYRGDWQHFAGLVTHLYLNASADFAVNKAKMLVAEALKPGAYLEDISYCWEGLGKEALPVIAPLLTHEKPEIAFAAARAAAFVGDPAGQAALLEMAKRSGHPFQLAAVQMLGQLPVPSPEVDRMLRKCLDSDQTLVRLEAYRILARNDDSIVFSKDVKNAKGEVKFRLDLVAGSGSPMVYATRQGPPRIVIFGVKTLLRTPIVYTAIQDRFSISTLPAGHGVTLFYRGPELDKPVAQESGLELTELVRRLAGEGAPGQDRFDFSYGDIVALLQGLADRHLLASQDEAGRLLAANFVLQPMASVERELTNAPVVAANSNSADAVPDLNPNLKVDEASAGGPRRSRPQ